MTHNKSKNEAYQVIPLRNTHERAFLIGLYESNFKKAIAYASITSRLDEILKQI